MESFRSQLRLSLNNNDFGLKKLFQISFNLKFIPVKRHSSKKLPVQSQQC